LPEWIHLDVRLVAQGRKENYRARGVVVDCRAFADGLWNVSLFFTDFAGGENAWPPA
jgi:negative regulator of sigma E activity